MTAALAAPYTTDDEKPASLPAMLPLLMMLPEPWRRIWGAACFMPSITLRTSVAIAASKRRASRPSMPPVCAGPPALLNRQSMRPNFSTAPPISARICSSTVTSVWRKMQAAPSLPASASPSGARRPAMTILAPSATKTSAVRKPMPLVAPVITATLLSNRPILFSCFCDTGFEYISGPAEQHKPCWLTQGEYFLQIMIRLESDHDLICLFEHDLFGKPVSTFPDHALGSALFWIR